MTETIRLISVDEQLGSSIAERLHHHLGHTIVPSNPTNARPSLAGGAPGHLLLAMTNDAAQREIAPLVHETRLQCLPWTISWVDARQRCSARNYAKYEPYLDGLFHWPDDVNALVEKLRPATRNGANGNNHRESIDSVIERQLARSTPSLIPMVEQITLTALHDVTVLLTGETGTGKTFLARLIHECSPRKQEPFVVVACGALAANLMESTFFGHVRGAFTGADRDKEGKFAAAGKGTILLDEIDTLPWETQASLLRVIESGELEPVGSNVTQKSEARVIVTSNVDLDAAVRAGKFREDLYYRLNVMSFHLPPLRERPQDVRHLAGGMAARFCTRFHKDLFEVSAGTIAALEGFGWPGNLRQLENVMQQAVLLSSGPILLADHLPPLVSGERVNGTTFEPAGNSVLSKGKEATERSLIRSALERNNHNRSRTAEELRISRVTLYKKLKRYGLDSLPR